MGRGENQEIQAHVEELAFKEDGQVQCRRTWHSWETEGVPSDGSEL